MAAERKCCVPNCGKSVEILHRFPHPDNDPDRFRTWLYAVDGEILAPDNLYIYKYQKVCHLHFEKRYHTWNKRLTANAVPTLKLPGFSIQRRTLADITNKNTVTSNLINMEVESQAGPSGYQTSQKSGGEKKTGSNTSQQNVDETKSGSNLSQQNVVETKTRSISSIIPESSGSTKKHTCSDDISKLIKEVGKLKKAKDSYRARLKKALTLSGNATFQKALKKLTSLAAIFILLQFRLISKAKMARRFSKEEKIMALSIYKTGPKAYRLLRKIFVLPSPITLSRMISTAALKPGINENIFRQLEKKVRKMKNDERLCTLIFDEMALTPHFEYNRKKDRIIGFVNDGKTTKRKIADHILVFMIRGVTRNYKQPIYYSFCSGSTPKDTLAMQIKEIIEKLYSVGFIVLATVCDQGPTNTSAIHNLINETKANYLRRNETLKENIFEIKGNKIIPLYDVPHLLKGIRNNLITKNLKYIMDGKEKIAKWEHITELYKKNPTYKGLKMIKNLGESHCIPQKIPKMKVKFAAQLFSQTVGKTMGYLADNGLLPEQCKDTADIILFFDELFDSMNGSLKNSLTRNGKDLLRNITSNSRHKEVWKKSKLTLKSMKFMTTSNNAGTVPSITNWLHTVENMELLIETLSKKYKINSVWGRHFNQDPLENFFGSIRSHGVRNNAPTCAAFEAAFASLLVNNMNSNYCPGSNCEDDSCNVFASFNELFFNKQKSNIPEINEIPDCFEIINNIVDFSHKKRDPIIIAQLQYVAGYILKKSKKIIKKCKQCHKDLMSDSEENSYLKCREYVKNKCYLTYPNEKFVTCLSEIQDVVDFYLKNNSNNYNVRNSLKTILYVIVNTDFITCRDHKKEVVEFLFDFTVRFFCCVWCRNVNKLLNGSSMDVDKDDYMRREASEYFSKRRKK